VLRLQCQHLLQKLLGLLVAPLLERLVSLGELHLRQAVHLVQPPAGLLDAPLRLGVVGVREVNAAPDLHRILVLAGIERRLPLFQKRRHPILGAAESLSAGFEGRGLPGGLEGKPSARLRRRLPGGLQLRLRLLLRRCLRGGGGGLEALELFLLQRAPTGRGRLGRGERFELHLEPLGGAGGDLRFQRRQLRVVGAGLPYHAQEPLGLLHQARSQRFPRPGQLGGYLALRFDGSLGLLQQGPGLLVPRQLPQHLLGELHRSGVVLRGESLARLGQERVHAGAGLPRHVPQKRGEVQLLALDQRAFQPLGRAKRGIHLEDRVQHREALVPVPILKQPHRFPKRSEDPLLHLGVFVRRAWVGHRHDASLLPPRRQL